MRTKYLLGCLTAAMLIMGLVLPLYARGTPMMPVDEIRPGMKGIGKTVFSGTKIEEFDVEIIDVLHDYRGPGTKAIMAKVTGGPLPLEHSGVLGGMSGSPIYIDGKLIGALAFSYILPKKPMIAGITPIHEMLRDANRPRTEQVEAHNLLDELSGKNGAWASPQNPRRAAAVNQNPDAASHPSQPFQSVPIQTPLVVSGVDQRVLQYLKEQVKPLHFVPVQGGSSSEAARQETGVKLEPGSAVAVQLVQGDMDMSAVGTVTYRDEETILAFGHSMFQAGNVSLPMATAYVNFSVANYLSSYKVASGLTIVGSITRDWETGISGQIGHESPLIPLDVTIRTERDTLKTMEYSFDVADFPQLFPFLMRIASMTALLTTEKTMGEMTLQTSLTIESEQEEPLQFDNFFSGDFASAFGPIMAVSSAFAPLDTLVNNQFAPFPVKRVAFEVTLRNAVRKAEIVGIRLKNNVVSPGEEVEATVTLRPAHQELTTITETVKIPEDMPRGRMQLLACDSTMDTMFNAARASAKFQPRSLAHLIRLLREQVGQNTLLLSVFQPRPGIVVQGKELPSPPVSMMSMMGRTHRYTTKDSLTQGRILAKESVAAPYMISGCTAIELTVNHYVTGHRTGNFGSVNMQEGE